MAWLPGYGYRKEIPVKGSTAGVQTNYQMKLKVVKEAAPMYMDGRSPFYASIISPTAYYYNGKTYVVFQTATDHDPYIDCYTHSTGAWTGAVKVADNPVGSDDSHGAPAVIVDNSGYIHVFFGSHVTAQKYSKSTNMEDISAWTAQTDMGTNCTYPNVIKDSSGTLWLFLRETNSDIYYRKSTDFTTRYEIIESDITEDRIYRGNTEYDSTNGRIHMAWTHNDLSEGAGTYLDIFHAYLKCSDGHMYSMGGTDLGTTISFSEAGTSCKVVDTGTYVVNASPTTHLDSSGNPYIIYSVTTATGYEHKFTRWTGSAWSSPVAITTSEGISSSDFIVNSSSDIDAYLIIGQDGSWVGDLEHWSWNGSSWSKDTTILAKTGAHYLGLAHPNVVVDGVSGLRVVFCELDTSNATKDLWIYATNSSDEFLDGHPSLGCIGCGGNCQDDFDDIRFTKTDGSTELDHWREEYTSGKEATFWIEFDSIAASPSTTDFYIYYSKAGGSSGSNGGNTFILFDDFERGSDGDELGGIWTEESGTCEISTDVAYGGTRAAEVVDIGGVCYFYCAKTAGTDYAIRCRFYTNDKTDARWLGLHGDGTDRINAGIKDTDEDIVYYDTDWRDTGSNSSHGAWHLWEINDIDWTGNTYDIIHDGVSVKNNATLRVTGTYVNQIAFGSHAEGFWIDDFIVRKWCNPEPTWGTWGSEESATFELSITDGLEAGDTTSQNMVVSLSVTEGLKGGDTLSPFGMLLLADGVKLGEVSEGTKYEYYNTGDVSGVSFYGDSWVAQTFTPSITHKVTSVKLKLYRYASPGTITVSIKATDGSGHPTGADLCSGTTDSDTLPTGSSHEWRGVTLGLGYNLTASTKYAIVLRALSGDSSNWAAWRTDNTAPTYGGGNYEWSANGGSSWVAAPTMDCMFEEWSIVNTPLILACLSLADGAKLGDIGSVLASLGITEGLKLGDTFVLELITLIYYLTLTEGLKFGDRLPSRVSFNGQLYKTRGAIAEYGNVSAFLYHLYGSTTTKIHVDLSTGSKDLDMPGSLHSDLMNWVHFAVLTDETTLWVAYFDAGVELLVNKYTIGESSVSLDSSEGFGDATSRLSGLIKLSSSKLVLAWRKHAIESGKQKIYFAYTDSEETWHELAYEEITAGNASMQGIGLCQHPSDGSIWHFSNNDGTHNIDAIRLTESGETISVESVNESFIPSYSPGVDLSGEEIECDGELPFITALQYPKENAVLLAYERNKDRISFGEVEKGSQIAFVKVNADKSKELLFYLNDYTERTSPFEVGVDSKGDVWVAYGQVDTEAVTWNDLHLGDNSLGRLYGGGESGEGDSIYLCHSSNFSIAWLSDNKIYYFPIWLDNCTKLKLKVNPTGYVEHGWTDEEKAYDDSTDYQLPVVNYAYESSVVKDTWSDYLELTHSAINCDGVWIYPYPDYTSADQVDVYYEGAWHNIYDSHFTSTSETWIAIPDGIKSVTAMRYRGKRIAASDGEVWFLEADFRKTFEVTAPPETKLSTKASLSLTDGVKLGDALSQLSTISVSITDGTKLGDANAIELTGVGFYLYLTEGLKLGDTPLVSFLASLQLSDGTKLGDSELLSMVANLLDAEGIKFGDTLTLSGLIYLLSLTDGIKLGDTDAIEAVMNLSLSDGTKLGDVELREIAGILVTLTDGMKMGDSSTLSALMNILLSDGAKFGDLTFTSGLANLVKLLLLMKTIHNLRVFTEPYHNVIIWAGEEDMTIRRNWQRGETVRIWAEAKLTSTNELYDPDQGVVLYVYDPDGTVLATINGEAMTNSSIGMYYYDWNSASDSDIGWYRAKGKAQDGTGDEAKITIENGGFELGV